MKLSVIEDRIPRWYENRISFHLEGQPGIGKTSIVTTAAKRIAERTKKRIGLIVVNGTCLTLPDALGYGIPNRYKGKDGKDHTEMVFSEPFFSRTVEGDRWDDYDGGLLFVDEHDKCELDVKKVIGEARLSGRLGPHLLSKGWMICSAGNRSKDRSGSTKNFDHEINRTMWINVELSFDDWEAWASANGVMPVSIAFAKQNQHIVFPDGVPEKQGAFCTARSFTRMDAYFQSIIAEVGYLPDDGVVLEEAASLNGAAMAHQYFGFLRIGAKLPTTEQIVARPDRVEVPSTPDGQMIVCYNLARDTTNDNVNAVTTYVNRCDAEFAATYYRSVVKANKHIVKCRPFMQWALKNSALMALLQGNGF